jgi:glycosyltransferase involved in cell wall biosynthesis
LRALSKQTLVPDEIVIADNGSPKGLDIIVSLAKEIGIPFVIAKAIERGAGPARNAGVLVSGGSMIAFLDSDCRPLPDWLMRGRNALSGTPIVGGKIRVVPKSQAEINPIEAWDIMFGFDVGKSFRVSKHLLTGNLFVRRATFEAIGPFRNGIPEDAEWCHRATKAGYQLRYDDQLIVEHLALTKWDDLARRWMRVTNEEYCLARESRLGLLRFTWRSVLIIASVLPHSLKIVISDRIEHGKKWAVFLILFKIRLLRFLESQRLIFERLRRTGSSKKRPKVV